MDRADLGSEGDSQAMEAIRKGMNLRKGDCGDFWEDFISVCGNPDGLSALLGVPKEKITGWGSRVRKMMQKVSQDEDQNAKSSDKKALMPTGDADNLAVS